MSAGTAFADVVADTLRSPTGAGLIRVQSPLAFPGLCNDSSDYGLAVAVNTAISADAPPFLRYRNTGGAALTLTLPTPTAALNGKVHWLVSSDASAFPFQVTDGSGPILANLTPGQGLLVVCQKDGAAATWYVVQGSGESSVLGAPHYLVRFDATGKIDVDALDATDSSTGTADADKVVLLGSDGWLGDTLFGGRNSVRSTPPCLVQSASETDPQTLTPAAGEAWIVAVGGVNEWAGQDGKIAVYRGEADVWLFVAPIKGTVVYNLEGGVDDFLWYTGAAWAYWLDLGTPLSSNGVNGDPGSDNQPSRADHQHGSGPVTDGSDLGDETHRWVVHSAGVTAPKRDIVFADSPYTWDPSTHRVRRFRVDTSGGAVVWNLPSLTGLPAYEIVIQRIGANAVTITPNGVQTIRGAANLVLAADGDSAFIAPNSATDWDHW